MHLPIFFCYPRDCVFYKEGSFIFLINLEAESQNPLAHYIWPLRVFCSLWLYCNMKKNGEMPHADDAKAWEAVFQE